MAAGPPSPEHERRQRQMARFGAILFGASAIVTILGLLMKHQPQVDVRGLEILAASAGVAAVALLLWGERAPLWVYMGGIALATVLVSLGVVSNGERHGGAAGVSEIYYLWVIVYAAYYFGRLATAAQVVVVAASYAVVLRIIDPGPVATSRWIATVGLVVGAAVVVRLFSERMEALVARLGAAAHTDSLTGLANRLAFEAAYRREVARANRENTGFALLLADLDQLKAINDRFGHQAGDEAICAVANVLRRTLRASDFPARIGGDEFAVLLPSATAAGARLLGERLSRALSENGPVARSLGLSYGVAVPTEDCHELDDVMRAADDALYDSKKESGMRQGRGRMPRSAPAPA
jgi:diguanylate cyclase (GGDEF)-like protein